LKFKFWCFSTEIYIYIVSHSSSVALITVKNMISAQPAAKKTPKYSSTHPVCHWSKDYNT